MNLSQRKRQRMLELLARIREEHKGDDDTLIAINEIENELNAQKYGLIWEEHEEAVDIQMRTHIPVFTEDADKEITAVPDGDYNFLLEGDNLHSLYLLEKTHKGRIDVIYIDPPYNRGKDDFVYDDKFIGTEDSFKHSKWLSFMEKRLRIAYNLLSDDGLIFLSIDDNEQAALKNLMDQIFSEDNFIITIPRITKKAVKLQVHSLKIMIMSLCIQKGIRIYLLWKNIQTLLSNMRMNGYQSVANISSIKHWTMIACHIVQV